MTEYRLFWNPKPICRRDDNGNYMPPDMYVVRLETRGPQDGDPRDDASWTIIDLDYCDSTDGDLETEAPYVKAELRLMRAHRLTDVPVITRW